MCLVCCTGNSFFNCDLKNSDISPFLTNLLLLLLLITENYTVNTVDLRLLGENYPLSIAPIKVIFT